MSRNDIEASVVRAFVAPAKRERYVEGLSNPKRRSRFLDRLNHHIDDIDPQCRVSIPSASQSAAGIEQLLRARGAPSECYVMSSWARLDGREMPLGEALREVVGRQMGTLISCVPGRLGYYESEEIKARYLLERTTG